MCEIVDGDRGSQETFTREHCFFTPLTVFLISGIQMAEAAGRHASGDWEWGPPSLLLCRSHLLPSLFALLSVAFSCRPINQTYTYTPGLTHAHICQQLAAADV